MTMPGIKVLQCPIEHGWIQASLSAADSPRAGLLVLPPFFHEWQRGYRLFALLSERLALRGISVLRFDYRGTGDSSGGDSEFLPSRALEDADIALSVLREHCPAPITVLGIRGGALLAEPLAARHALPWWAWQPVDDGASHLKALRERDRFERNNRLRFPFLGRERRTADDVLMGHRIHPEFGLELGIFRRTSAPACRIDAESACRPGDLALPPEFIAWAEQLDLQSAPALKAMDRVADTIAERLLRPADQAAA